MRPVVVTLATVFTLFVISMAFSPIRGFFFPEDTNYPLFCTAEPYAQASDRDLLVDFYVINRTGETCP